MFTISVPQMYFFCLYLVPGGQSLLGSLSLAGLVNPLHLLQLALVQLLLYFYLSGRYWLQERCMRARIFSDSQPSAFYWQLFVIGGLAAVMVLDVVLLILMTVTGADVFSSMPWVSMALSAYLFAIALFSLFRPEVFFRLQQTPQASLASAAAAGAAVETKTAPAIRLDSQVNMKPARYKTLSEELVRTLGQQLEALMSNERLYLCNDLSLLALAQALGVSVHHMSELLNLPPYGGFYEYVNRYRLAHARALLTDPGCKLRILDIAFESGFSNKNSFYKVFRENFQSTPQEYRNNAMQVIA